MKGKIQLRIRFADKDLQTLYENEEFRLREYGSDITKAFRKKVAIIDAAVDERDLRAMKSLHFEKLHGDRAGQHSIRLNRQWRLILTLETDEDGRIVVVVEIADYH